MQVQPGLPRVELWSGHIPAIGWIAHHHWLVVEDNGARDRWEVWQSAGAGSPSWGHLHKNLMAPEAWIYRQPKQYIRCWEGEDAKRLAQRIVASPLEYPWKNEYRYWPGPNSNTYVQWILESRYRLGFKAPGRGWA